MKLILRLTCLLIFSLYIYKTTAKHHCAKNAVKHAKAGSLPLETAGQAVQRVTHGMEIVPSGYTYHNKTLTYVDRQSQTIFHWKKTHGNVTCRRIKEIEGEELAFAFHERNSTKIVIGSDAKIRILTLKSKGNYTIKMRGIITNDTGYHIAKARPDNKGHLFLTLNSRTDHAHRGGRIYRFNSGKATLVYTSKTVLGDLKFSRNNKKLYLIHDNGKKICSFDYDEKNYKLSNKKSVFNLTKTEVSQHFIMTGIDIDSKNHIWVSVAVGGFVAKVDVKDKVLYDKIPIPNMELTGITFGNSKYKGIFVGTAKTCTPAHSGIYFISGVTGGGDNYNYNSVTGI